jgi:hypothetical protein
MMENANNDRMSRILFSVEWTYSLHGIRKTIGSEVLKINTWFCRHSHYRNTSSVNVGS